MNKCLSLETEYETVKLKVIDILNIVTNTTIILYGKGCNGKTVLRNELLKTGIYIPEHRGNIIVETNDISDKYSYEPKISKPDNIEIIIDMNHIKFN